MVVLRFPHLMLADVGRDDGVAFGQAPDVVDHVRRVEVAVVGQRLDVAHGRIALHRADVLQPLAVIAGLHDVEQILERMTEVSDDRGVRRHVLVDL